MIGCFWSAATLRASIPILAMLALASAGAEEPHVAALITACQACHGTEGISVSPDIPNLAGQKKDYLVRQLQAFRSKERKNDLMEAIAGQLSDADIQALAAAWSQMPGARVAVAPAATLSIRSRMEFPADFPQGFTLYQTVEDSQLKQVDKRYANEVAMRAAREGRALPSGAAIIGVSHALEHDAQGKPTAGKVLSYAAMSARAGWGTEVPQLLRNGDWDYALFDANRVRRDGLNQAQCLACHKPVAADSYVFTMKQLREATQPQAR